MVTAVNPRVKDFPKAAVNFRVADSLACTLFLFEIGVQIVFELISYRKKDVSGLGRPFKLGLEYWTFSASIERGTAIGIKIIQPIALILPKRKTAQLPHYVPLIELMGVFHNQHKRQ